MGLETVILSIVSAFVIFGLSFSIILNVVFIILLIGIGLFLRNVLIENSSLVDQMSELDSQLIVSDSVHDIVDHILSLRDVLEEVTQMDLYVGEPVLQHLLEKVIVTLEKIESSVITQEYLKSIKQNE